MSKRDELEFSIKKSLVVGTASATLVGGCIGISNPGPGRIEDDAEADVAADAGSDAEQTDDVEPSDTEGGGDTASADTEPSDDTTGSDTEPSDDTTGSDTDADNG